MGWLQWNGCVLSSAIYCQHPADFVVPNLAASINDFKMALNVSPSKITSLVFGPTTEPLWNITLGALIEKQAAIYGERTAVVFPQQNIRRTYRDLLTRSRLVSKALIEQGLKPGDCVGIFAGNRCEYVEVFLGAGAIGCPVVVLNAGYTPIELRDAIAYSGKCNYCDSTERYSDVYCSGCKVLCAARFLGPKRDVTAHLDRILEDARDTQIILFDDADSVQQNLSEMTTYSALLARGNSSQLSDSALISKQLLIQPSDTLNLQFTSGKK